ncbi:hypothetical protein [Tenacibaculum sp. IB213877]|uniref:hypothetical protein n=1 Tax=Tenacibaculum sp. IB213877 TaxID=3097351 RepID=UPI002A5AD814|nr:hypothetical protein [Tenacibaculum sp. IB213877]MDY0779919.1 hypothetical protein [Tenacibaculum sp. IB213877]
MNTKISISILFFILININLLSQSDKYDVSILINNKINGNNISNDSLIYQTFFLPETKNYIQKKIFFNEKGELITNLIIPDSTGKDSQLVFYYKNDKGDNPPKILKKEKVKNLIVYPKDFIGLEISKARKLLQNSKNIFIIESDSIFGYYVLKKVILKDRLSGL